jgi:hypothetical protein
MSRREPPTPDAAPCPDQAEMTRLRDEMRALMQLFPGSLIPGNGATGSPPDSLSDQDAVEAGFDNLPV